MQCLNENVKIFFEKVLGWDDALKTLFNIAEARF